jgi:hypothetical protein
VTDLELARQKGMESARHEHEEAMKVKESELDGVLCEGKIQALALEQLKLSKQTEVGIGINSCIGSYFFVCVLSLINLCV